MTVASIQGPAAMARAPEDLNDMLMRKLDEISGVLVKKPTVPPWLLPLVMYLVGQLVGSIWWAATISSDLRYLQNENLKAWQKIETHDLQLGKMDNMIRSAVKEAMEDADYVRVRRQKGE